MKNKTILLIFFLNAIYRLNIVNRSIFDCFNNINKFEEKHMKSGPFFKKEITMIDYDMLNASFRRQRKFGKLTEENSKRQKNSD